MKIFNVVFFYLISGPVSCYDVSAFIGGQVIIHCFPNTDVYFCKFDARSQCEYLKQDQAREQRRWINNDRFTLGESKGSVQMTIRNLSLQDAGMYECGDQRSWRYNIQLKVNDDPCCTGTQSVRSSLGQSVTISCSYPVKFKNSFKYLYKLEGDRENQLIHTSGTQQNQEGRFSISVDERNNVFRVNIRDLREDDKGVYSCVLWERETSVGFYSFFTKIHLQVTENPDGTSDTRHPVNTIISMCICVSLLLLIGAFVLVYKLKGRKTQDSPSFIGRTEENDSAAAAAAAAAAANNDYQNNPPHRLSVSIVYQNLTPDTSQSDSVYQHLDPNAIQSFYQRLNPNTISSTGN